MLNEILLTEMLPYTNAFGNFSVKFEKRKEQRRNIETNTVIQCMKRAIYGHAIQK